jgi:short-subunit dehydrogenase
MKTIIITGASSGIGRALALRAAQNDFATVLVGRNGAALEEVAGLIHDGGGLCTTLTMDITDPQAASAIVSTTVQRYGAIDVVVNNAGIAAAGLLYEQSDRDVRLQLETHVLAALRLTRWALPELAKSKGQVFFFGSGVARVPTPNLGAYPLAKAAVRAMSTQMRGEIRSLGVAVTYVDPGAVDTPFMQRAGMAGPPQRLMVSPHTVAKKIIRAVKTRPHAVNAVPWQTAMVGLSELFPALTDAVLAAFPAIVGTAPLSVTLSSSKGEPVEGPPPSVTLSSSKGEPVQGPPPAVASAECHPEPVEGLDAALAPVAHRMQRVKLPREFIEKLLVPGTTLELGEVAMRWAGMPNKNERAAVAEVFDALTSSQYLQKTGDETWTVLRSSDS